MSFALPFISPARAVTLLNQGGIVVFPTETFYAVGGLSVKPNTVQAIFKLKNRSLAKPLPLAVANLSQLGALVDLSCLPKKLLDLWPGPLTLVLKVLEPENWPKGLLNSLGEIAVRISSHPLVQTLAEKTKAPLTVSSANFSGDPAVKSLRNLDARFLANLKSLDIPSGLMVEEINFKYFAKPSTILRYRAANAWEILREGAISKTFLEDLLKSL